MDILNKLLEGQNLTQIEAEHFIDLCSKKELSNLQIAAALAALRVKGETPDEIAGLIQGMRAHMQTIYAQKGTVDTCGTGGDRSGTFNISTAAAFVAAGAGVKVAKHGNRAASSICGSADVLEALGVNINLTPKQCEQVLAKVGIVFLFAQNFNLAIKIIGPIRKKLATRTVFNFLGPFLNPP